MSELNDAAIKKIQDMFRIYAKENHLKEIEPNWYEAEVHTDYRDIEEVQRFVDREKNISFDEAVEELYENFVQYDGDIENTSYYRDDFIQEYEEELTEILEDTSLVEHELFNGYYEIINISSHIDYNGIFEKITKDALVFLEEDESFNMEFGNNDFSNILLYNSDFNELTEMLSDSSARLLLESQGYSIEEFVWFHIVDDTNLEHENDIEKFDRLSNDVFFVSIYNEIVNAQNSQSLVVPMRMSFKEFEALKKQDTFTVESNQTIGYLGVVDGSGSMFEVKLKNSIELSKEQFKVCSDGEYGYAMRDVYGDFLA